MLLTFALCVVGVKLDVMLQAARAARRSRTRHPVCCKLCDTFDVTNYTCSPPSRIQLTLCPYSVPLVGINSLIIVFEILLG